VGRVLCLRARRSLNESSNHRLRSERRAIGRSVRSKPIRSAKYAANPARGERVAAQKRKREREWRERETHLGCKRLLRDKEEEYRSKP